MISIHHKLLSHNSKNKKDRAESFQQSQKRTILGTIRRKLAKYAIFDKNHKIQTRLYDHILRLYAMRESL